MTEQPKVDAYSPQKPEGKPHAGPLLHCWGPRDPQQRLGARRIAPIPLKRGGLL